jgi:hypothetical protein
MPRASQAQWDRPGAYVQERANVGASGSIGLTSEAYFVNGIDRRRDPATLQLSAKASASAFGFSYGVNVLVSTQQTQLRQSMSRLAISSVHRRYEWLAVAAGDVSPTFSRYSLSGVSARGGYVELTPGKGLGSVVVGRAQRAVAPDTAASFRDPAFERWLYGARLGYGSERGTHLHLSGLYVRDRVGSLHASGDVRPASNLVLAPKGGLVLWDRRLHLQGEITASALTRDLRASASDDAPGWLFLDGLHGARVGSRLDYAGEVRARVRWQPLSLQARYDRVEPGFESLGLAQQRSDQEQIRVRPRVRLLGGRAHLGLDLSQRRNNLGGDLTATQRRRQVGVSGQWQPSRRLSLSGAYTRLENRSTPTDGDVALDATQTSQTATLTPVLVLQQGQTVHSLSLTGTYQQLRDAGAAIDQGLRTAADFDNVTTTLAYGLTLPSGWSLNANSSMLRNTTAAAELSTWSVQAGAGASARENALRLTLNGGWSRNRSSFEAPVAPTPTNTRLSDAERAFLMRQVTASSIENGIVQRVDEQVSTQWTLTATAGYRLLDESTLHLQVRGLHSATTGTGDFQELQATLRFQHRF